MGEGLLDEYVSEENVQEKEICTESSAIEYYQKLYGQIDWHVPDMTALEIYRKSREYSGRRRTYVEKVALGLEEDPYMFYKSNKLHTKFAPLSKMRAYLRSNADYAGRLPVAGFLDTVFNKREFSPESILDCFSDIPLTMRDMSLMLCYVEDKKDYDFLRQMYQLFMTKEITNYNLILPYFSRIIDFESKDGRRRSIEPVQRIYAIFIEVFGEGVVNIYGDHIMRGVINSYVYLHKWAMKNQTLLADILIWFRDHTPYRPNLDALYQEYYSLNTREPKKIKHVEFVFSILRSVFEED